MPTSVYHITHIRNLPSILEAGGLMATNSLRRQRINYVDIAYPGIQDRRAITRVPCGAGGVLHDYVPFYFAPRSPMLYTIHKGNVESYREGQAPVIHLVCAAEAIEAAKICFVFTDGHAVMGYTDYFDELQDLAAIDWEIMEAKYWADTDEDGDRKRRRQAEFLIHQFCPWTLIEEIGVISHDIKGKVEEMLGNERHCPPVKVCSDWYY
ncbi:MAG: DUF4433 domain-containing protein [Microcystis viridis Mv_BB_P_19951000_S69]|jgi:hypothetical protein|uniref:DUF4433 domain-containing protein n=2 Tax=Microcystis TaxID=1125 RepID=A0A552HV73_MICVR|nr:MAG: DUF4433 domain-containing protein [Microcystis viridis Mv_BB_P_19951000_S68]TRU75114.1 MAG: DUF4433 domain-containing protein [Microcystis viridis Mv_BB_P_19951000_S68D]TRU78463.1 MAG: DUF4433 domain-containing protein [Microcystis viridis Mv_BB_P_19951000_S69]TRU82534.1 MAG: DUF4433 domain-containing protein [Microcystis viridis Mv_BB_P_19951000_S69D]